MTLKQIRHRRKVRRARYQRMKAANQCIRCRGPAGVGKRGKPVTLCAVCMVDQTARADNWKARHADKNREIARKARRKWRRKQARTGGCANCSQPATKHGRCDKHYEKDIERRGRRNPRRPLKIDRRDLLPLGPDARRITRLWVPEIPAREPKPVCACGLPLMTGRDVCWCCDQKAVA
jgi:hypothetical protein